MMKRTFALFFFLVLMLSARFAIAEESYSISPAPKERICYTLTPGIELAQPPSVQNGRLSLVIDSEATNWATVLTSMRHGDRIELPIHIAPPDKNSNTQVNTNTSVWYDEESSESFEECVLQELSDSVEKEIQSGEPASSEYHNAARIARYDSLSGSVIPEVREGYFAHLVIWSPESSNPVCEYFFIDIQFTDDSARKVSMAEVSASRIGADAYAESAVVNGSVSYTLPLDHTVSSLNTLVFAPDGATHYAMLTNNGISERQPVTSVSLTGENRMGFGLGIPVQSNASVDQTAETIFWYASADAEKPFRTEHLNLSVVVGTPEPYPHYYNDLTAVPEERLIVPLYLSDDSLDSSFINMRYEGTDGIKDTYRITVSPGQIPEGIDLDNCAYMYYVAVPDNAVGYTLHSDSSSNIYGTLSDHYDDAMQNLYDKEYLSSDYEIVNGRKVVFIGCPMLATSRSFSHDPDLKLYTPVERTGTYAGGVNFICWYDEKGKPFIKEYFITKTDPFSLITAKEALTDESQLPSPSKMTIPVIILSDEDAHVHEGRTLYLAIENYVYAGKNCVVYGLHVQDAEGNKVELQKDATIILPYPKGVGMGSPGAITLNHYDEEKGLIRYSEDSTDPQYRLTRTPHGISFQNQTFSPFVLSWEDAGENDGIAAAGDLPQTGDSSLPLLLLLAMLSTSVLMLACIRRARV